MLIPAKALKRNVELGGHDKGRTWGENGLKLKGEKQQA